MSNLFHESAFNKSLADQFNEMADKLQDSYTDLERKVEVRTEELARSVEELRALGEISQAVNSTLDVTKVLETIVARGPLTLSELAGHLRIPKSSVHRACSVMVERDWALRRADGRYDLGIRAIGLGARSSELPIEDRLRSMKEEILSRSRLQRIVEDFNLYPEERQRLTMEDVERIQEHLLAPRDERRGLGDAGHKSVRDHHRPVPVGMDQVIARHHHAGDAYRAAELH